MRFDTGRDPGEIPRVARARKPRPTKPPRAFADIAPEPRRESGAGVIARALQAAPPAGVPRAANDFPAVPLERERPFDSIRELYLYEEPQLLASIRQGDYREARHVINHILVHIYSAGQERSGLLKGLLLELVVMMSRTAVECGARPSDVLGQNFQLLSDLAPIDDDERLAAWLTRALDQTMDAIRRHRRYTPPVLVTKALGFMRANLHRDISRDETARHAGISPAHFSRVLRERTGWSFTGLLRQCRVEAACGLLRDTEKPLAAIAADCGFCDQSYFTRVFQQARGMTPREYREANTA